MKAYVNFVEVDVKEELTYDEICALANKDPATVPTVVYSLRHKGCGHVFPGETFKVDEGVSIGVMNTNNA